MKPLRGVLWACGLVLLGTGVAPARGAWDNVFQVCCNSCGGPVVSRYAPEPCASPCQTCTTRYVQRCYYQPVVAYQTRSYYEPVTTYRTSYYYEPVTTVRYSCYYDPCSCSYQQTACPTTSYYLRSQCCPVQSWAQRCYQVPVTTYTQASYWEPVTTCTAPPPPPCCPSAPTAYTAAPQPAAPACEGQPATTYQTQPPPAVSEQRNPQAQPGVQETPGQTQPGSGSPLYDRSYPRYYPPQGSSPMPSASGSSLRQPPAVAPPPPPPSVRLDRIVALPVPERSNGNSRAATFVARTVN